MVKIDTDEMENGKLVAEELGGKGQGLPWLTILDGDGNELANSTGPKGNIGCPVKEDEQAYFIEMLQQTRQHNEASDIKTLAKSLADYAASM